MRFKTILTSIKFVEWGLINWTTSTSSICIGLLWFESMFQDDAKCTKIRYILITQKAPNKAITIRRVNSSSLYRHKITFEKYLMDLTGISTNKSYWSKIFHKFLIEIIDFSSKLLIFIDFWGSPWTNHGHRGQNMELMPKL